MPYFRRFHTMSIHKKEQLDNTKFYWQQCIGSWHQLKSTVKIQATIMINSKTTNLFFIHIQATKHARRIKSWILNSEPLFYECFSQILLPFYSRSGQKPFPHFSAIQRIQKETSISLEYYWPQSELDEN